MGWESRGGRSQEEKPTNGPGVPTRHSGRRERRFQKGRCSLESLAAERRGHFEFFFMNPGEGGKRPETASGRRGLRRRVFCFGALQGVKAALCLFPPSVKRERGGSPLRGAK